MAKKVSTRPTGPASIATKPTKAVVPVVDVIPLAQQIFARIYRPGGGRKPCFYAEAAVEAAEEFARHVKENC